MVVAVFLLDDKQLKLNCSLCDTRKFGFEVPRDRIRVVIQVLELSDAISGLQSRRRL